MAQKDALSTITRSLSRDRARSLLEDLLPQNIQIEDFEVEHDFEHIGRKTMLLNARKMPQLEGRQLILLVIEDISDRQHQEPETI